MKLLLDTQAVLWFWRDDPQLSANARAVISDPANQKFVSTVTRWGVAIKVSVKSQINVRESATVDCSRVRQEGGGWQLTLAAFAKKAGDGRKPAFLANVVLPRNCAR